MRDCLMRGESPYASHLLYTQPGVLRDHIAGERQLGMRAGWEWGHFADAHVFYTDRGMSSGMNFALELAEREGRKIEYRSLNGITLTDTPERVMSMQGNLPV